VNNNTLGYKMLSIIMCKRGNPTTIFVRCRLDWMRNNEIDLVWSLKITWHLNQVICINNLVKETDRDAVGLSEYGL